MSYKSAALALSPVGLWMFDEASGTTINDTSGNSQNGTYQTSGVTLGVASLIANPGGNGTAVSLNTSTASNFLGSVPNSGTIALQSFTFVMWIKFQTTNSPNFACAVSMSGEGTGSTLNGWEVTKFGNTQPLEFRVDSTGGTNQHFQSNENVFDGNVHFFAVSVVNGSLAQDVSVDGGAWETTTYVGSMNAPTVALTFGNDGANLTLNCNGTYQGAAMFSGQLSAANLLALFNAASAVADPPPQFPLQAIRGNDPWWTAPKLTHQHNVVFHGPNPPSYDQHLAPIPARQQGMTPWTAPVAQARHTIAPFHPPNPPSYDQHLAPLPAVQAGMQLPWAPVPSLHPTIAPFNPPNPPSYDHHLAPIPAVQAGMKPWWAPVPGALQATTLPFSPANPPSYDQHLAPLPAVQAGMAPWRAPVAAFHPTTLPFSPANPPQGDQQLMPVPAVQAGMRGWWAPVPALQATVLRFSPANPPQGDQQLLPPSGWQLGMAPWWAPVPQLHPTITEFHGATENDWRPVGFPFQALGQPWWAPVPGLHPTIAPFQAANPPEFTTYKIPLAIIQQGWWAPPALLARGSPNDAGGAGPPPPGADPIVVWRHRAGMQ